MTTAEQRAELARLAKLAPFKTAFIAGNWYCYCYGNDKQGINYPELEPSLNALPALLSDIAELKVGIKAYHDRVDHDAQTIDRLCAERDAALARAEAAEKRAGELEKIRPSVLAFAKAMTATLAKHDAKKGGQNGAHGRTGWRQDPLTGLIGHAQEELEEVEQAENHLRYAMDDMDDTSKERQRLAEEAVDLANMAMMIWDKVLQLDEALDTRSALSSEGGAA